MDHPYGVKETLNSSVLDSLVSMSYDVADEATVHAEFSVDVSFRETSCVVDVTPIQGTSATRQSESTLTATKVVLDYDETILYDPEAYTEVFSSRDENSI